jgi:cytochrome c-type biogenesis protein CcmH/NrfF
LWFAPLIFVALGVLLAWRLFRRRGAQEAR